MPKVTVTQPLAVGDRLLLVPMAHPIDYPQPATVEEVRPDGRRVIVREDDPIFEDGVIVGAEPNPRSRVRVLDWSRGWAGWYAGSLQGLPISWITTRKEAR